MEECTTACPSWFGTGVASRCASPRSKPGDASQLAQQLYASDAVRSLESANSLKEVCSLQRPLPRLAMLDSEGFEGKCASCWMLLKALAGSGCADHEASVG